MQRCPKVYPELKSNIRACTYFLDLLNAIDLTLFYHRGNYSINRCGIDTRFEVETKRTDGWERKKI